MKPGDADKGQAHVSVPTWSISAGGQGEAQACLTPSDGDRWAEGFLKVLERWKLNQPGKEIKQPPFPNHRGAFQLRGLAVPIYQPLRHSPRQFIIVLPMNAGTS